MRAIMLALSILVVGAAAQAQTATSSSVSDLSAPQEVGNTTMPPGNYVVTEQASGKSYNLMVSSKGTMILAPATKAAAVTTTTVTTVAAPAAAVAPGAVVAAPQAAASPVAGLGGMLNNQMASQAMKGLMNSGVKQIEKGAGKNLSKYLK